MFHSRCCLAVAKRLLCFLGLLALFAFRSVGAQEPTEPLPTELPPPITIEGNITAILEVVPQIYRGGFRMGEQTILVALDASIVGLNGDDVPFSNLAVGKRVVVVGRPGEGPANSTFGPPIIASQVNILGRTETPLPTPTIGEPTPTAPPTKTPEQPSRIDGVIAEIFEVVPAIYQGGFRLGTITATPGTAVMVGLDAEIVGPEGDALSFGDLTIGHRVVVDGRFLVSSITPGVNESTPPIATPTFVASRVKVLGTAPTATPRPSPTINPEPTPTIQPSPTAGEPIRREGTIAEFLIVPAIYQGGFRLGNSAGTIGLAVIVDLEARVIGRDGEPISFGDLTVGDRIEARGQFLPAPPPGPTEQIFAPTLIASEVRVLRNTETPRPTPTITPVETPRPSPTIRPTETPRPTFTPVGTPIGQPPIRIEGVVESISLQRSQFVVRGVLVRVTDGTELRDDGGTAFRLVDLMVGNRVIVTGAKAEEGVVIARLVLRLPRPTDPPPAEFTGAIAHIDYATRRLFAAGTNVNATSDTVVLNQDGRVIRFAELRVGDNIRVKGTYAPFPTLAEIAQPLLPEVTARSIELLRAPCLETVAEGDLAFSIGEDPAEGTSAERLWCVGERCFSIVSETEFSTARGEELTIADFAEGDRVAIKGCIRPDRGGIARHVVLLPEREEEPICRANISFAGIVSVVDTDTSTVVVGDRTVLVTEQTRITGRNEGRLALADVAVGDLAHVDAFSETNDTRSMMVACFIRLGDAPEPPPTIEHRIVGRIDSITTSPATLVVRETTITVSNETEIIGRRDGEFAFGDLTVGLLVDVRGLRSADGVLAAARIRVQEENLEPKPLLPIRGLITALALPASLTIGDRNVVLTAETEFIGPRGEAIDSSAILVGDAVVAFPDRGDNSLREVPPAFVAKRVRLNAAILESIGTDPNTITVAGERLAVTDATVLRDSATGDIAFADLVVGDLLRVRRNDGVATFVLRVALPDRSGPIGNWDGTGHGNENGHPWIEGNNPANSFGFISLPVEMELAEPNTLYELTMGLTTNVENPFRVPVTRLRLNTANFEKGSTYVITSAGGFQHTPGTSTSLYRMLFMPPAEFATTTDDVSARFFASLDVLSFEDRFDRARFRIENVAVSPIASDRIGVAAVLAEDDFSNGTDGWTLGGAPDVFPAPFHSSEPGALTMAPSGRNAFGFWTKDTGVAVQPGRVYRARFLAHTTTADTARVPRFRLRLNTSSFQLATTVNIDPTGPATETLRTESRVYDVYVVVPANDPGTDTLLASFDLMHFDGTTEQDAAIVLEQFILEEIAIAE